MKNDVVVLIPSYEPDQKLIDVVTELIKNEFPVLVINDGSGKNFEPVFNQIKSLAQLIEFPTNRGKGDALKEGYKNIPSLFPEAKYVITADGDGQHAIKDIIKMYNLLKETGECVLGVRRFDKTVPFRSRFGNYYSQLTRSLVTKTYLEDDQCGLRGFPIRFLPELTKIIGHRYDYEINQLTCFQLRGYTIIPMPVELIYEEDNNQKTHFKNISDTTKIQVKIAYQGLPSLISLSLLIAGLIVLYAFGFSYYHLIVFPAYIASSLLTVGIWTIVQPSKKPLNRLLKELLFTIIKMMFVFGLMYLFLDAFRTPFFIAIPLLVIIACFYNWLLPRIFK